MHAWYFLRMTQLLDSGVCLLIYLSCIGSYNTTYIFNYSGVCMHAGMLMRVYTWGVGLDTKH